MNAEKQDKERIKELGELRSKLQHGDNTTQHELDQIRRHFDYCKDLLRPGEKDEAFRLVDSQGNFMELIAPRWQCHLLSLRHRTVHVLLQWQSPSMGNVFIFQVRNWRKPDSPGHLDISVGGHVTDDNHSIYVIDSAYREMEEELGINSVDLIGGKLDFLTGYESYDEDAKENFFNAEWRNVYLGVITTPSFDKLRNSDGEVVGLYLCPESEAKNLLEQPFIPLASALRLSLPFVLSSILEIVHGTQSWGVNPIERLSNLKF